jgi:hypothetical protein
MDKEVLYVGGGFLLALVAGPSLAWPLFQLTKDPIWTVVLGSAISMGLYVGGCLAHARAAAAGGSGMSTESPSGERQLVSSGR